MLTGRRGRFILDRVSSLAIAFESYELDRIIDQFEESLASDNPNLIESVLANARCDRENDDGWINRRHPGLHVPGTGCRRDAFCRWP